MKFNLVDDRWIAVRTIDGDLDTVSLREFFHRAGELTGVAGDIHTQDFAVLRIALAVFYRTLWLVDESYDVDVAELWDADTLPLGDIDSYLDTWHHRFELFDAQQPFMQVADLATASGKTSGLHALVAGSPGAGTLFTMQQHIEKLTPAEAARWLIHCQAFDISGIKPGALGDLRVSNGKGYPIGIGWCGWLGGLTLEGRNLRETLIHNFAPPANETPDDLPVWELEPLTSAGRDGAEPDGPIGLFTWPIRRVRLYSNGTDVTDVLICNGDPVPYWRQHTIEPMSGWRYSDPQTKKRGSPIYMAREHDPARALWRTLSSILPDDGSADRTKDGLSLTLPAKSLTALANRCVLGDIPDHVVTLRSTGIQYGSNNSVYSELISDGLTFHPALAAVGSPARHCVDAALNRADATARAFGTLGGDIALASGGDVEPSRGIARERAYSIMDHLFREWLTTVIDANAEERLTVWTEAVRMKITEAAEELVNNAPVAALAMREAKGRNVSAGTADMWFRRNLRDALGKPAPEPTADDE